MRGAPAAIAALIAAVLLGAAPARAQGSGSIMLACGRAYEVIATVHARQVERVRLVWFDAGGAAQGSRELVGQGEGALGTGRAAGRQRLALPGPEDQRCRVDFAFEAGDPPRPVRDVRRRERSTDTCLYAEDGDDGDYDDMVLCFYAAASGGEELERPAPPAPP